MVFKFTKNIEIQNKTEKKIAILFHNGQSKRAFCKSLNAESGNGMREKGVPIPGIEVGMWRMWGMGGNAGNQGGNAENRGGNASNKVEIEKAK